MKKRSQARKVVIAALIGNLAIAATKFVAAGFTGSAAMLSEGIHSLVDTINELLLLYGLHRAALPPSNDHPFGRGRELYFWSFIVSLLVFALGAGVSFYEGVSHLAHPNAIDRPLVNYVVLGLSLIFEGSTWWISFKEFRASKGTQGWFEAFRNSKDASTITVLFEDSAAVLGLGVALIGLAAVQIFDMPMLDGVASLGIAIVLAASSLLLARETKALLLGEPARPAVRAAVLRIAGEDAAVRSANGVITVQMGPHQIVAALSVEFKDHLTADDIEACVNRIEAAIKQAHPDISVLFVKPQTAKVWAERAAQRVDD